MLNLNTLLPRMRAIVGVFAFALAGTAIASAQDDMLADIPDIPTNDVYSYGIDGFGVEDYFKAVENLMRYFEVIKGTELTPAIRGKVGLKVYSDSGPGLSTPESLVEAVIRSLERRGYDRTNVFILGSKSHRLRSAGFLPPLSQRRMEFNEVFVRSLDSGEFYDEGWFYDSPLPSSSSQYWINIEEENPFELTGDEKQDRKSYLPMPLMHEVDFWINLPCYSDHPTLGINGALMNATLWNASNTRRFLSSPASAPVAVAEMGAIPELRETWALNIASLERYQYVGGPIFNSLYTVSEPIVLLSDNPVMLDALMSERINFQRRKNGFAPLPEELKILAYSEQLGLGDMDLSLMSLIEADHK